MDPFYEEFRVLSKMCCGLNKSAPKKKGNTYPLLISTVPLHVRSNCNIIKTNLKGSLLDLGGTGVGFGKSGLSYGSATDF